METTEITVTYAEKVGLPNYSNSLVELVEVVLVNDGDDPVALREATLAQLRARVRAEVDLILEANGRRAKYDQGPRFKVLKSYPKRTWIQGRGDVPDPGQETIVVILPTAADPELERFGGYRGPDGDEEFYHGLTLRHARRLAVEATWEGARLIDCSDGDLAPLAPFLKQPEPVEERARPGFTEAHLDEEEVAEEEG